MYYSFMDQFLFFIIYGIGGFALETVFRSIINKKFTVQGGFLTNYFCPLYGLCGIVIIQIYFSSDIFFYNKFAALLAGTIGSIVAVTSLEYLTGLVLDKVFHCKLWDYSGNPFNIHGYICLEFSIIWGIVAISLSSFIHPIIEIIVMSLPDTLKYFSILILGLSVFGNSLYNISEHYKLHNLRL